MTYRMLKLLTVLIPPMIIGGFEFIRHSFLLPYLSMDAGNVLITILTFFLSYWFAAWMFRTIDRINQRLNTEQARRAVYEERERLAQELHDNIAQTMFFLKVKLKQGQLEEAATAVNEMDQHLRQAIFNLRSSPDDGISLVHRIQKWLAEWSALTGVEVQQQVQLDPEYFTPGEEVHLFGVIQEAFTNIRKHSRATSASLHLDAVSGRWTLRIGDNGCGIADEQMASQKYGLRMMRERANRLGAELDIRSLPGGGTELVISAARRGIA